MVLLYHSFPRKRGREEGARKEERRKEGRRGGGREEIENTEWKK